MAILVMVCGKMCGKIEKLSDWNKNWCGSIYGPHDYDSGNDDDDDDDDDDHDNHDDDDAKKKFKKSNKKK